MITGNIEAGLHPLIALEIAGTQGSETLFTLVDTGFNWNIGLHYDFADRLGLEIYDFAKIEYANGQSEEELVCHGRVKWHEQWQEIDIVLSADEEPSLGTGLLNGCVMTMNFIENTLTIDKPLPQ
jgi:predicted aspartyl protease